MRITINIAKIAFFWIFALMAGLSSVQSAEQSDIIRIGIPDDISPWVFVNSIAPTMEHLRKTIPDASFALEEMSTNRLNESISSGRVQFFIIPSGEYSYLALQKGALHLATRRIPQGKNPAESVGAVFVVRRNSTIHELSDLKRKTAAAVSPTSIDGTVAALGEIRRNGFNPDEFFKNILFTHHQYPDPLSLLEAGEVDVAIINTCELERLLASGANLAELRVVGAHRSNSNGLRCLHSTDLYPELVFASLSSADSVLTEKVLLSLLNMKSESGSAQWGLSNSFQSVSDLYRSLKLGPYEYLRFFSFRYLISEYTEIITTILVVILLTIVHIIRTNLLVKKKTAQLRLMLEEKSRLEKETESAREKLAQWERMSIVASLSNMIAHELGQPITSLINFASGLRMYLASKNLKDDTVADVAGRIVEQSKRIAEIVSQVRTYAKHGTEQRCRFNLNNVVKKAIATFRMSSIGSTALIEQQVDDAPFEVEGSPLELELLVVNLLKNAAEASKSSQNPKIVVKLYQDEGRALISVEDNGPRLDDDDFRKLACPIKSLKQDGLGLGLNLCMSIAEHHAASLSFERLNPSGIAARFSIPCSSCEKE